MGLLSNVHATPVVITNFSFEDDVAPVGGVMTFVPTGWTSFGGPGPQDIGSQNANATQYSANNPLGAPAEGNQFTYVNMFASNPTGGGIYLDVGELLANTQYTLTVAIGSRADRLNSPGIISLINGVDDTGTILATGEAFRLPRTPGRTTRSPSPPQPWSARI